MSCDQEIPLLALPFFGQPGYCKVTGHQFRKLRSALSRRVPRAAQAPNRTLTKVEGKQS